MNETPKPVRPSYYITTGQSAVGEYVVLHGSPPRPEGQKYVAYTAMFAMLSACMAMLALVYPIFWLYFGTCLFLLTLCAMLAIRHGARVWRTKRFQLEQLIKEGTVIQIDPALVALFKQYLTLSRLQVEDLQAYFQQHSAEFLHIQQDILPILTGRHYARWTTRMRGFYQLVSEFEDIAVDLAVEKSVRRTAMKEARILADFHARAILGISSKLSGLALKT